MWLMASLKRAKLGEGQGVNKVTSGSHRSSAHAHIAELLVGLALGPPLLQLLLAPHSCKVVRLLDLVVELDAVLGGPVLQEASNCMEVLHQAISTFSRMIGHRNNYKASACMLQQLSSVAESLSEGILEIKKELVTT